MSKELARLMREGERFLSPEQLAERYGVPVSTIYRWNYSKNGPRFVHLGRHCRYRLSDVEAWEESKLEAAT